ncbi:unnamed protein product [Notodromas monacha]|uniref:CIDE-N domain-containing protein n=1 Tax=Notodromas monacha TaxID=399045 RepID=A0A7R9BN85_9CRUS|nr:unnamed protein product [Notodromas monacha]CAG0917759.1 unnamed protein product [Notodromas monacha]
MSSKKACKVWDSGREKRKGLVATSYEDLRKKGCATLNVPPGDLHKVVLERDGTQVCDSDYFDTLPDQTVFMFIKHGEDWSPQEGSDVVDSASVTDEGVIGSHRAWTLFLRVLEDPRTLTLMSNPDLIDLVELGDNLNSDGSFPVFIDRKLNVEGRREKADLIFDAAVRILNERQKISDAVDYVTLYQKAEAAASAQPE